MLNIKQRLSQSSLYVFAIYASVVLFLLYTCCYAYRKPFTVGLYRDSDWGGFDLKIIFVLSEIVGYACSKFIGTVILPSIPKKHRIWYVIGLLSFSELAWMGFGAFPTALKIICVFFSGLPLGMIWGILFSFIEGRRISEVLNCGLSVAMVVSSGLVKTLGQYVLNIFAISEYWMPCVTGALVFPFMLLLTYLLNQIPEPDEQDRIHRTERAAMSRADRRNFFRRFFWGICTLIVLYGSLTVFRELRDSFAADLWAELDVKDIMIFTKTEYPIAFVVLIMMFSTVFIRNNRLALNVIYVIAVSGGCLTIFSTVLYVCGWLNPVWWMIWAGLGMYMGYIPFTYLIERLIASLHIVSTAVFILYLADSFGYLGTVGVYVMKNFSVVDLSWNQMLIRTAVISSVLAILSTVGSYKYFRKQLNALQVLPDIMQDDGRGVSNKQA